MSSIGDFNYFEDQWYDSPMFTLVDPNVFCPGNMFGPQHQVASLQTQTQLYQQQQMSQAANLMAASANQFYHPVPFGDHKQIIHIPLQQSSSSSIMNATSVNNCKQIQLHQQLQLRKALSQQRQDQLRARLDQQALADYTAEVMPKPSTGGKKMTGRERQLELEKQEDDLREHQERLKAHISVLELKCDRLRDILINIVTTSPEFNDEMIKFLEASDLLVDNMAPENQQLLRPTHQATTLEDSIALEQKSGLAPLTLMTESQTSLAEQQ